MDEIATLSKRGTLIIVEGEKDERILREMGASGLIFKVSRYGCGRLLDFIEQNDVKEIIILTDFDSEGEALAKKCEKMASNYGVKVDKSMRLKLYKLFKLYSESIEGLWNVLNESLKRRIKMGYLYNL